MPRKTSRTYILKTSRLLKQIFGDDNVIPEWDAAKESEDAFNRTLYCPRLDIAVRPFNTDEQLERNKAMIDQMYCRHRRLFTKMRDRAENPNDEVGINRNPRCFLAIEVERNNTTKHMLGSIVNATSLGRFGIMVAWESSVTKSLGKIQGYLRFLRQHGKIRGEIHNAIIIERAEFLDVLREHLDYESREVQPS